MGIHAAYSMLGLTEEYGSDMSLELVGVWVCGEGCNPGACHPGCLM
jgi:hypothetical protein